MLTPIFVIFWLAIIFCSVVADVIIMVQTRNPRTIAFCFLGTLGLVLTAGFLIAGVGLLEGAWTVYSPGFVLAMGVGCAGIACFVKGYTKARQFMRVPDPGKCSSCGYPVGRLAVCTECGAALPAAAEPSTVEALD